MADADADAGITIGFSPGKSLIRTETTGGGECEILWIAEHVWKQKLCVKRLETWLRA